MVTVGFLARLIAKPGQEEALEGLLKSALDLANAEAGTVVWFAFRIGRSEFGIFDAFADEAGRRAHLQGRIAAALMARADELLAEPPSIREVDVLAAKF
jgi:quinol monooxygenase YgiN